jgi:hypothetical protein
VVGLRGLAVRLRPCTPSDAPITCQAPGSSRPGTGRFVCADAGWTSCLGQTCDFAGSGSCPAGQFCVPDGGCRDDGCTQKVSCVVDAGVAGEFACANGELARTCQRLDCVSGSCDRCQELSPCVADGGFVGVKRCDGGTPVCEAVSCPKQQGVCAGAKRRLEDDGGCTGISYGREYDPTFDRCVSADGGYGDTDNNCDGFTASGELVTLARNATEVAAVGNPTGNPYVLAISLVDGGQLRLEAMEFDAHLGATGNRQRFTSRNVDAGLFSPSLARNQGTYHLAFREPPTAVECHRFNFNIQFRYASFDAGAAITRGPRIAAAADSTFIALATGSASALLRSTASGTLEAHQPLLVAALPVGLAAVFGDGAESAFFATQGASITPGSSPLLYGALLSDGGYTASPVVVAAGFSATAAVTASDTLMAASGFVPASSGLLVTQLANHRDANGTSRTFFSSTVNPAGSAQSLELVLSERDGGRLLDGGLRSAASGLIAAGFGATATVTPIGDDAVTKLLLTDVVGPVAAAWSATNAAYALIAAPVRVDGGTTAIVGRLVCMPPPVSF